MMKHFLRRMWVAFQQYQERRATYMVLNRLSDAQLKDLGFNRGEIDSLFSKPAN
jgi:uncharacterized protein YjiS (DUF1127 family)